MDNTTMYEDDFPGMSKKADVFDGWPGRPCSRLAGALPQKTRRS